MSTHTADPVGTTDIEKTRRRLDPARSSVEFQVKGLWGLVTVKGSFTRYRGTLKLSDQPAVDLTIEAASLDTGNEKRDAHLRSADFFDAEEHRSIRFVSQSVTPAAERLRIRGTLIAAGASLPLELEATLRPVGEELEIEAATEFDHRRLGMTWNWLGTVRTPSRAVVKGRLVRDDR